MKIDRRLQALPISVHEMAPMRAFFDFTKMVINGSNDPSDDSFSFIKFVIFDDLERKNKFHGNHASHTV